jgi:GNAT superfamily N-acetyltransferase
MSYLSGCTAESCRVHTGIGYCFEIGASGCIMPYDYMQKILNYQRENGCRGLLRACLTSLKHTLFFYEKEVIGGLSVANSVFSIAPKIPVIVRPAAMSDVPDLKVLTTGYKKRDFPQWIRDGYIFYLAQLTAAPSSIIGYICVCPATKARHKLVSILKLRETDYWAIDAFIHPDYRRKGINSAIASGFFRPGEARGVQKRIWHYFNHQQSITKILRTYRRKGNRRLYDSNNFGMYVSFRETQHGI